MEHLRDLEYTNFLELLEYLESVTGDAAISVIGNFFPNLTALQEIELGYIIDSKDEKSFERFKEEYPDLEIDPEGKAQPKDKNYWEVTEKALNYTFDAAFSNLKHNNFKDDSQNKGNSQVYNAKTLAGLKNIDFQEPSMYPFKRKLFIDKNKQLSHREFNRIESLLRSLDIDPNKLLIYVIAYCKDKKYENYNLFLDHVFKRIELLVEDKNLVSNSNKDFLESINAIINKNK
jgi:hypothetical protein